MLERIRFPSSFCSKHYHCVKTQIKSQLWRATTRLPPLSSSPQCVAFHLRDSNNRFHDTLPRDRLLLAILRGRIETWKEGVDRNLSWFNQLVINSCFEWALGLAERENSPHPSPLPEGEGACLRLDGGCGLARF